MGSILRHRLRPRRVIAALTGAAMLHACGGGGAAPPSAPQLPAQGAPPSGPAPSPRSPAPAQPQPPTPPPSPPAGPPSSATISTPGRTFSPGTVTIAVNGKVTWQVVEERHTIHFTGVAPAGGSPGEVDEGGSVSRTFTTAGTYEFECLRHRDKGMRGAVIVQAAGTPPPPPTAPPPSGSTATVTTPNATFSPSEVTIATGGSVTWQFSEARHNVTFQGAAPTGGNIPDQDAGTSASRTFPVAGTYDYVCTRHSGMTGRVTVR